jgi:hypothetical protein
MHGWYILALHLYLAAAKTVNIDKERGLGCGTKLKAALLEQIKRKEISPLCGPAASAVSVRATA